MIKIFTVIALFWFNVLFAAHDDENCKVLDSYDFSKFDNWKQEVVQNSSEYSLDSDFVANLVAPYSIDKNVIKNDKCQPEFTLTFSEYLEKRISKLRFERENYGNFKFVPFLKDVN